MSIILNTDLDHIEKNYQFLTYHLTSIIEKNSKTYSQIEKLVDNSFSEDYNEGLSSELSLVDLDIATKIKLWALMSDYQKNIITAVKEFSALQTRYHAIVSKISYVTEFKSNDDEEMINVDEI